MSKRTCLKNLIKQKSKLIVGLNSGTSADGIDAALVKIDGCGLSGSVKFLKGSIYPFAPKIKARIEKCAEPGFDSAGAWLELDTVLGELFAVAALRIIKSAGFKREQISLIGSHGQTIRHLPKTRFGAITHQLADPARIAARTGITTVGDFRVADAAAGGQGAPLTPIANAILFSRISRQPAILNIGGIANISVIARRQKRLKIFGCDTGPGNMVIDSLSRKLFDKEYDSGGRLANKGLPNWSIINKILMEKFFVLTGPKSTGRENFGQRFVERYLALCCRYSLSKYDTIATATMLSARAVYQCVKINKLRFDKLIITGGGVHNRYLINALQQLLGPADIIAADDTGFPADYLEAISFATLANEAINSNRYDLSKVTGSRKAVVLGKICQA